MSAKDVTCDDLGAEYQPLHACGVQFDGPPQQQPWATDAVCRGSRRQHDRAAATVVCLIGATGMRVRT
jgi:hypothetical protein